MKWVGVLACVVALSCASGCTATGGQPQTQPSAPLNAARSEAATAAPVSPEYVRQTTLLSQLMRNQALGDVVSTPEPSGDIDPLKIPVGGRFLANLVDVSDSPASVTFDVVSYYNGDAALAAAKRDGSDPPVNATYQRNRHVHEQTLPVDQDCVVGFLQLLDFDAAMPIALGDDGNGPEMQAATWTEFVRRVRDAKAHGHSAIGPFWLSVDGKASRVTSLVQQYGE